MDGRVGSCASGIASCRSERLALSGSAVRAGRGEACARPFRPARTGRGSRARRLRGGLRRGWAAVRSRQVAGGLRQSRRHERAPEPRPSGTRGRRQARRDTPGDPGAARRAGQPRTGGRYLLPRPRQPVGRLPDAPGDLRRLGTVHIRAGTPEVGRRGSACIPTAGAPFDSGSANVRAPRCAPADGRRPPAAARMPPGTWAGPAACSASPNLVGSPG